MLLMKDSLNILEEILRLHIGISQADNETLFNRLSEIYPLRVLRYESGREHNGWIIPPQWSVHKALIQKDGKTLFNGCAHPLAVASHSASFKGTLSKRELDRKVFFRKDFPDAYAFHCIFPYRPWIRDWGFCVPYNVFKTWGEGFYDITLETEFTEGHMLVGECRLDGTAADTVVFNAHTCHPCQANDDLAGTLVVLELFSRLSKRNLKYSYLGVLAPEFYGTVFYLADMAEEERNRIRLGCFVEMVGTETPFALQKSFTGKSIIDRMAEYVLKEEEQELTVGDFATVVGNDETVWEAPGIEVPMVSISRWPYPQYHTSSDDREIISEEKMVESLDALDRLVFILENDALIHRKFEGLIALSNPKYDLYFEHPDPVVQKNLSDIDLRFAGLQDHLQRFFDGKHSVFEIAERFGVPFDLLFAYLEKFQVKGLVELQPVESLSWYDKSERPS